MRRFIVSMPAACCLVALTSMVADAQQPAAAAPAAHDSEELAKKLSNPISDLVSVPFQFNWQQKIGPLELSQFILSIQPVMRPASQPSADHRKRTMEHRADGRRVETT